MCRLYGFYANEPTKVECTLVHAQNALMAQSRSDRGGKSHGHGWGIAAFGSEGLTVERQAWAAHHGEHFERAAARTYANVVVAHVRRATVGEPDIANTHPFVDDGWALAHNGTVAGFDHLRSVFLENVSAQRRKLIKGATDSEHLLHLIRTKMDTLGRGSAFEALKSSLRWVLLQIDARGPRDGLGLNLVLTNGEQFCGSRLGRSLYYVERDGVRDCQICGFPHVHHHSETSYKALVVASEPLSNEDWTEIPDHSFWYRDLKTGRLALEPWAI